LNSYKRILIFRFLLPAIVLLAFVPPAQSSTKVCPKGTKLKTTNVRRGETFEAVAKRVQVTPENLKKWNRRLRPDKLKVGQNIRYCVEVIQPGSIGACHKGSLVGGRNLDPDGDHQGIGFVTAPSRKALWATKETISYVKKCAAEYRRKFPKGAPMNIGDLSKKNGGPLGNHLSHQSGRDVDIGYMTNPPQSRGYFNRNATRDNLDLPKQWAIVQCFLDNPDTMYIFLSHTVKDALLVYVNSHPKLKSKYGKYFRRLSILRPDNEHHSHMHVRFKCPKDSKKCKN